MLENNAVTQQQTALWFHKCIVSFFKLEISFEKVCK